MISKNLISGSLSISNCPAGHNGEDVSHHTITFFCFIFTGEKKFQKRERNECIFSVPQFFFLFYISNTRQESVSPFHPSHLIFCFIFSFKTFPSQDKKVSVQCSFHQSHLIFWTKEISRQFTPSIFPFADSFAIVIKTFLY